MNKLIQNQFIKSYVKKKSFIFKDLEDQYIEAELHKLCYLTSSNHGWKQAPSYHKEAISRDGSHPTME